MENTQIKVQFIISTEEISPDEITSLIGIVPDVKGVKGELLENRTKPLINSFWSLNTGYIECNDILTGVEYIYNNVYTQRKEIREVIEKYDCDSILKISIKIYNEEPPVTVLFDRYLTLFGSFKTRIDINIFIA